MGTLSEIVQTNGILRLMQGFFPEKIVVSSVTYDVVEDEKPRISVSPFNKRIEVYDSDYMKKSIEFRERIYGILGLDFEVEMASLGLS